MRFILSIKGVSSSGCVSGTVHTGGASLSIGLGMMRDLAGVVHWPLTRLVTECGVVADPSEVGSNVAQDGRLVMQRRLFRRRAADEVGRRIESIMMMVVELLYIMFDDYYEICQQQQPMKDVFVYCLMMSTSLSTLPEMCNCMASKMQVHHQDSHFHGSMGFVLMTFPAKSSPGIFITQELPRRSLQR